MPHLTAKALVDDKVGMAFLARVLDAPVDPAVTPGRSPVSGDEAALPTFGRERLRRRRKTSEPIPEAA